MVTSPGFTVAAWLSVTAIRLMLNQGRSILRPAGRRRRPSEAVWSVAVCEPHRTETPVTATVGAAVTVRRSAGLVTPARVAVIPVVPGLNAVARPVGLIDA